MSGNRIPALDGLRGLAVLLVVAHHALVPGFELGDLGVDIFFVLSGFLITSILATEYNERGSVRLGAFYARRAVRLLPALALLLALMMPALAAIDFGPLRDLNGRAAAAAVLWVGNWASLFDPDLWASMFAHLWSLGIEDQFYILWAPLLPVLLLRAGAQGAVRVLLALSALSALWALVAAQWLGTSRAYLGTDTRAYALLVGCALGIMYVHHSIPAGRRAMRAYRAGAVGGAAAVAVLGLAGLAAAVSIAAALSTVCLIALVLTGGAGRVGTILRVGVLRWFGLISYGLYLWHFPVMWLMWWGLGLDSSSDWPVRLLVAAPLSVGIAAASYYLLEQPLLQARARRAYPTHTT